MNALHRRPVPALRPGIKRRGQVLKCTVRPDPGRLSQDNREEHAGGVNAGLEGAVVLNKVLEGKDDFGFNAQIEKYENLIKAGVIDPTKVTRTALENAASVASLLVTTEAVVYEKKEKEPAMPPMPGGGMGDMG